MEISEGLCLLFTSGEFYYLTPVFCVQRVTDGAGENQDTDMVYLSGEDEKQNNSGYLIHLETNGRCAVIRADYALRIVDLKEETVYPLESPVIHEGNRYIRAVVPLKDEEKPVMAYVLDSEYVLENKELWTI